MSNNQIYATYLLYNSIFIEQQLELDNFGQNEQQEISNIAIMSYLSLDSFIENDQDIMATQTDIRENIPKNLLTVTLDTLQDIIALDNNIQENLHKELKIYVSLGKYYYQQNQKFFPNHASTPNNPAEFFSLTMFFFETLLVLEENAYSISKTLDAIKDHEYADSIKTILVTIKE
ncbi:MAG: hypothetical protein KFW21_00875 [Spirochaetota bacterium]|nr:hypothetical protein [Spirochaetota bacterium]